MSTESEIKTARYNQVEKEADGFGRIIGVRRLRPSEQSRLAGMLADLSGSDEVIGENGEKVIIPHRTPLVLAASVCLIDDNHISFPRNRGELDAIYDRLDAEGLTAVARAASRLGQTEVVADPALEAKN